ncbi:MAG TPA: molybdate ABC transporter permease subunit, partial [Catenuloplanes sp.]
MSGERLRARRRIRTATPLVLLLPALLGLAFLILPLGGLLIATPWSTLPARLADPAVRTALGLSLLTATLATVLCLILGVPLAWVLARVPFP